MTASSSVIPQAATFTYHDPAGYDVTVTWDDMADALLAAEIGDHLVMPSANEPLTPTIAFGDGTRGFYEISANVFGFSLSAALVWTMSASAFSGALGGALLNEAPSTINPSVVAILSDPTSGLGGVADKPAIIANGVSGVTYEGDGTDVIQVTQANVGLTAHTDSVQGAGVILSSYNVYTTVGTAGDAATLPAVFAINTLIFVKNDAAVNSMDVFPASGDDAGAGADTAVAVAAGDFAVFMATVANATWTKLMGGTA